MAGARTGMPDKVASEWTPRNAETINKMFETLFNRSKFFGGSDLEDPAQILPLMPAVGDLVYGGQGQVWQLLPIVGTAQRVLTNGGLSGSDPIPKWDQVDLAAGVTGKLPLANIVDFSATQRVWGRNSASGGVAEEVTFSQFLDWVGSAAQGDILYRGASAWARLAAGTIGQVLTTNGASANPAWSGSGPITAATGIPFLLSVTAGGALSGDGPFSGSGTITGTTSAKPATSFADGFYWHAATANTNGSSASYVPNTSGTGPLNFTWDFDVSMVMRTDIQDVNNVRYWPMVIGPASNPGNVDTLGAAGIGFRYSTVAGDGGWVGVTNDGTQAVTATVAAIAANTRYLLRIRKVGSTVFFSVNGGTEVSQTSHVPTSDTYASVVAAVTNQVTAAGSEKSLYYSRVWGVIGS